MKKILIASILVLNLGFARAQRFFYVETKNGAEKLLKNDLVNASQFVTESPIASDYTIKTDIDFHKGSHILTLNMILMDSLTFNTIYQSREEYTVGAVNEKLKIFLKLAITTFIDKNVNQVILSARDGHYNSRMNYLKPGKDKT